MSHDFTHYQVYKRHQTTVRSTKNLMSVALCGLFLTGFLQGLKKVLNLKTGF